MMAAASSATAPCEICAAPSPLWRTTNGFPYHRCARCVYAFIPPDAAGALDILKIYGDDYFTGGGAGYHDYIAEGNLLRDHGRRYGTLLAQHTAPGKILDGGAAAGFLLRGYQDIGWKGTGIEPNAAMAAYARERVGVDVQIGRLEYLASQGCFDAVALVQVIAHVGDLHAALERVASSLQPQGVVLVETWNLISVTARIFGKAWHEFSPPSVVRIFSKRALARAFALHGCRLIASGRPKKFLLAAHAKSLLAYKMPTPARRPVSWLLRIIPDGTKLPYPAEDLFWAIFGKDADAATDERNGIDSNIRSY